MRKQSDLVWKILFLVGVLILSMQIYFFLSYRNIEPPISVVTPMITPIQTVNLREIPPSNRQTPSPFPRISQEPAFISKDGEKVRQYINKKYNFSFLYAAAEDILEKTPERVVFGDAEGGMGEILVSVEPTTFSDPYEKILQINKDSDDRAIKENRIENAENFSITRQIREKNISIDGYPAIVTYVVSVWPGDGEAYPGRTVFFIKDKHLFTISTRNEDDHLWNSFKFDK